MINASVFASFRGDQLAGAIAGSNKPGGLITSGG